MDVILVRDLDSEISHREISAYNEFSYSEKKFHIMRDHPNHGVAILGPILDGKLDSLIRHVSKFNLSQDCNLVSKTQQLHTVEEILR